MCFSMLLLGAVLSILAMRAYRESAPTVYMSILSGPKFKENPLSVTEVFREKKVFEYAVPEDRLFTLAQHYQKDGYRVVFLEEDEYLKTVERFPLNIIK